MDHVDDGGVATVPEEGRRPGKTGRRRMSGTDESQGKVSHGLGPRGRRSFFEVYKQGQGRYTRLGTAVGGGILIAGAGHFLYKSLEVFRSDELWTVLLQLLVPLSLVIILGLVLYWIVAVNRGTCDFFIATEGEMKKVSWSSRNEIVGSTKVVIACTLLLGSLLFMVDAIFIKFFQFINVLWSSPGL